MDEVREAAAVWDAEYANGRYFAEPPVPFVADIVASARVHELTTGQGLYLGCGNGRNYLPLTGAGLDLTGLDISAYALRQLAQRAPEHRHRLIHGDLSALPAEQTFALVIGIQVFQHGNRAAAHAALRRAQQKLNPGGLFCLRVNAIGTDLWPDHEVTEQHLDGAVTIRYLAGPKAGLQIHFFSRPELAALFDDHFQPELPLRRVQMARTPPEPGQWSQWEGIWRKTST